MRDEPATLGMAERSGEGRGQPSPIQAMRAAWITVRVLRTRHVSERANCDIQKWHHRGAREAATP